MAEEKIFLTSEGLEKLEAELEHLCTVRRPEVIKQIRKAKELTDTVDNPEYDEAKNEQAIVEGRILEIEKIIKNASIFSPEKVHSDEVKVGSRVEIIRQDKKESYVIVGSAESSPSEGKISNESPLGQALLGKKVGEEIQLKVPAGVFQVKISAVE